jgi:hypothetical protein
LLTSDSYVHSLEDRVAFLELKLQQHGIQEDDQEGSSLTPVADLSPISAATVVQHAPIAEARIEDEPSGVVPVITAAVQTTLSEVMNLVQLRAGHEPAFSKLLLAEYMKSDMTSRVARAWERPPSLESTDRFSDVVNDLDASLAPLPDKRGAQYLTKVYFEFANNSSPLLHEPTFRQKLDRLYEGSGLSNAPTAPTNESRLTKFFVFMVFAVALLTMRLNDPSRVPASLCDRYHKTALKALQDTGLRSDIEGVQALLLMAQYTYHHPNIYGVWKIIGMALQLSVELGLHQDPPPGKLDFLTVDTMRRTFWVAYAMDRNIAIALGLPIFLSDSWITAKVCLEIGQVSMNQVLTST